MNPNVETPARSVLWSGRRNPDPYFRDLVHLTFIGYVKVINVRFGRQMIVI